MQQKQQQYELNIKLARFQSNNLININGNSNCILDINGVDNTVDIPENLNGNIYICGDNNKICIGNTIKDLTVDIYITGDNNNNIIVDENVFGSFKFYTPFKNVNHTSLTIGYGTSFTHAIFHMQESETSISIGQDCMISWDVYFFTSDCHTVIDNQTKKILNKGGNIFIGNHVWICKSATILKKVTIADNNIVGLGSVVCNDFYEKNILITGIPAKKVKDNIDWDRENPYLYTLKE